jgi:hypothetical protein
MKLSVAEEDWRNYHADTEPLHKCFHGESTCDVLNSNHRKRVVKMEFV